MKISFAFELLYFCTLVLPIEAAITRGVGPVSGNIAGSPVSTFSLNSTTIGRMIVIVIGISASSSTTITSINISGEADATRVTAANMTANGDLYSIWYLGNNTAGGNKTITVNFSANTDAAMIAVEYAGQDAATQLDATATPTSGTTGDPTISITTATAGDLIVTACSTNGGKPTVPSGYTTLSLSNPGYYGDAADNVGVGAAGSKSVVWTDGLNASWGVTAVAFRAAVVGGGGIITGHKVLGQ